jgi:hypothetical protein
LDTKLPKPLCYPLIKRSLQSLLVWKRKILYNRKVGSFIHGKAELSLEIKHLNQSSPEPTIQTKLLVRPDADVTKQYISPPETVDLDATQKRLLPEAMPGFERDTVDYNKETLDLVAPLEQEDEPSAWPEMVSLGSAEPVTPIKAILIEAPAKPPAKIPVKPYSGDSLVTPQLIVAPVKAQLTEAPVKPTAVAEASPIIEAPVHPSPLIVVDLSATNPELAIPESQKNTEPLPVPVLDLLPQENIVTSVITSQQARRYSPTSVIELRRPKPKAEASPSLAWVGLVLLLVGGAVFWAGSSKQMPEPQNKSAASLGDLAPKPEVAEKTIEISASLPSATPTETKTMLSINSSPSGATVLVDGVEIGETPVTIEVAADKELAVSLVKDGFEPFEKRLAPGELFPKRAALVRKEKPAKEKPEKSAVTPAVAKNDPVHTIAKDTPPKTPEKKVKVDKNGVAPNPFRTKTN